MTGYGRSDDRLHSKAVGFDAHLVKPIEIDDVQRLQMPLERRRLGWRYGLTSSHRRAPGTQRFTRPLYTLLGRALRFDAARADARKVLRQND